MFIKTIGYLPDNYSPLASKAENYYCPIYCVLKYCGNRDQNALSLQPIQQGTG